MKVREGYAGAPKDRSVMLAAKFTPAEVTSIDAWAIPARMPSRSEALRVLIRAGLEAMTIGKEATHGNR